jgi:acyl-CoA thioester hydrolase
MFEHNVTVRVRYSETDQMGFVYYGVYATYFEVARVETLRQLGISYKEIENIGVFLPVTEYRIKFLKPGLYDDKLSINTRIIEMPSSLLKFEYQTRNEKGVLLNEGYTSLAFLSKETGKPVRPPKELQQVLQSFF